MNLHRIIIATDFIATDRTPRGRALHSLVSEIERRGYGVTLIDPTLFPARRRHRFIPVNLYQRIRDIISSSRPSTIHIVSSGPIGFSVRRFCIEYGLRFTSSLYFPTLIDSIATVGITARFNSAYLRWFHRASSRVLTLFKSQTLELQRQGIMSAYYGGLGVDTTIFHPRPTRLQGRAPILLCVGALDSFGSIDPFLAVQTKGTKYVVGDGRFRYDLARRFPTVHFLGAQGGTTLAETYAGADLLVVPRPNSDVPVVLLEALASGLPIAALPSAVSDAFIVNSDLGCVSSDLENAIEAATRSGSPAACVAQAARYTWRTATDRILSALQPIAPWAEWETPYDREGGYSAHGDSPSDKEILRCP
ncbi:MAG: hypothetical protein RL417_2047 [Pseudomonadota bacterium]|jgi:glycosyltransferase involved in cell wall biosynthesis